MPNYCHIAKDKKTGEKFLIPGCYSVAHHWHLDMNDRDIIKEYCTCDRPLRKGNEKYCEIEKDEVIDRIRIAEIRMTKIEGIISKLKDELDILRSEAMLLNMEEDN